MDLSLFSSVSSLTIFTPLDRKHICCWAWFFSARLFISTDFTGRGWKLYELHSLVLLILLMEIVFNLIFEPNTSFFTTKKEQKTKWNVICYRNSLRNDDIPSNSFSTSSTKSATNWNICEQFFPSIIYKSLEWTLYSTIGIHETATVQI